MTAAIDLNLLQRLADPAKAAEAAKHGLPTLDIEAFKKNLSSTIEGNMKSMMANATSMVGGMMSSADTMIESQLSALQSMDLSTPEGKAASEALNALVNAKKYAISSGNFIPLLKITNPEIDLSGLSSKLTTPDFKTALGKNFLK